jgi:hypothetical protein
MFLEAKYCFKLTLSQSVGDSAPISQSESSNVVISFLPSRNIAKCSPQKLEKV